MLLNLAIKNYALIEDLRLEFSEGLSVFTGETGAGKSIIVESIKLLLGERASSDLVRKGSQSCLISGEFDCCGLKALKKLLKESALEGENDTLLIRREVDISARSRAFVNDVPVSMKTLSAIGEYLVDMHGQHEHQSLFSSSSQRSLLDNCAGNDPLLGEVSKACGLWKDILSKKNAQVLSEEERQRLMDIYSFQVNEIDSAALDPGEDAEIEERLPRLKNADKLRGFAEEAYRVLYDAEGAVLENLAKAQKSIDNLNALGGGISEVAESIRSSAEALQEAAKGIESYKDSLDSDPEALEKLLERQDLIKNLKKKYGSGIAEIFAFRDKVAKELEALKNTDENKERLEKEIERLEENFFSLCAKLSAERKKCADRLAEKAEKELGLLGMKKARFSISLEKTAEPSSEGWDKVEFMFQPNPGEELRPLKDIASGGEISRMMLAIKTVLAEADKVPVLIFDEIDTGVGGPMGQTIGKKLKDLSGHHQIICVTHLPQIAAFADQNISVTKDISSSRTKIKAKALSGLDRVEEIARMLSGEAVSDSARKHARELIADANPQA